MTSAVEVREWSAARPRPYVTPGKDPVPIVQEATDTTIAGINYKEQYECEWDLKILTNYIILYAPAFLIFINRYLT
jgi:hypothetical protein